MSPVLATSLAAYCTARTLLLERSTATMRARNGLENGGRFMLAGARRRGLCNARGVVGHPGLAFLDAKAGDLT